LYDLSFGGSSSGPLPTAFDKYHRKANGASAAFYGDDTAQKPIRIGVSR